MTINKTSFNETDDINLYTLCNQNGMSVKVTNFGAIVTSMLVPDRAGRLGEVVLGFDGLEPYLQNHPYFGALVGRYCGRISGSSFTLNRVDYKLAANDGPNHLHGGIEGFNKKIWQAEIFNNNNENSLKLTYLSKDGEEGYPGNLSIAVTYTLTGEDELKIDYEATTDRSTPLNLTHHGYFNLKDAGAGDILDHELTVYSDSYAPTDERLIPTGEIESVINTPLDFRVPHKMGERIADMGIGYDVSFLLAPNEKKLQLAARVSEPVSGRVMEVLTTEPCIHLYTANYLDGTVNGRNATTYRKHAAFCLEAQHFPDSVHHPRFPSTILEPGQTYRQTTVYRFVKD